MVQRNAVCERDFRLRRRQSIDWKRIFSWRLAVNTVHTPQRRHIYTHTQNASTHTVIVVTLAKTNHELIISRVFSSRVLAFFDVSVCECVWCVSEWVCIILMLEIQRQPRKNELWIRTNTHNTRKRFDHKMNAGLGGVWCHSSHTKKIIVLVVARIQAWLCAC